MRRSAAHKTDPLSGRFADPAVWCPERQGGGRASFRWFELIVASLLFLGVLSPKARAQECNIAPTWNNAIIGLPYPPDLSLWPDYVGGQVTPWYLVFDWNAPCLGTITVTSDYGQGPQTLLILPLTSTTGSYDNGWNGGNPDPNGGFPAPPPVAQVTPWTVTLIGAAGDNQVSGASVINLLPLQMSIELGDNKIVSAPGATTGAVIDLNADPSPTWFSSQSVQSSSPDVNITYNWPDGAGSIWLTLSATQDVTTAFPVTITATINSSNGIQTTASAQLSVQPTGDPGQCDPCDQEAGSPINLGTGNVWIQEKDYSLPGLGGGLQLTRTWNSKWQNLAPPALAGIFGHSWRSNFEEQLFFPDPNSITYYRGDGSSWVFALTGAISAQSWGLVSPPNLSAQLSFSLDQYNLILPDGTQRVFSVGGMLLALIDRNGNQTTLTYDDSNRLSVVTDAAGRSITFSYGDPSNAYQATAVQDSVGAIANYAYDSSSRLTRVTYADGSSLNFTYGSASMITSVTDGQGKLLESHTYDAADRGLTSFRAVGADLVTANFSTPGLTQLTDSLGNSTTYNLQYVGDHMLVNGISGPGCASCGGRGSYSFVYDGNGNRTSSTDALGNLTCYTYDGAGDILTKTVLPPGSTCPGGGVVFAVARSARTGQAGTSPLTSSGRSGISSAGGSGSASSAFCTGGSGNSAKFCTSGRSGTSPTATPGVPTVRSRALSPKPALSTGGSSSAGSTVKSRALSSRMAGVAGGSSSGGSVTWTYTYNNFQEVTGATDPAGNTTTNYYDPNGNLLYTTSPPPGGTSPASTTFFAYDSKGELTEVTDPNGNTTSIAYTPVGLVASITDAQGNTTAFTFDARGNRLSSTNALNQTTNYTYDVMNRLTRITAPDGSSTSFGYDYRGRRTSVTDANGNTTSYQYDDADRLVAVTDPAGHATSYQYNTENELVSITDAAGRATSFAYDTMGHVAQVTFPSTLAESYTYDPVENLLSKRDRKGQTINYSYDFLNRLTSKAYPDGTSVGYSYDLLNHLTDVTDPSGTYSFAYDNMGRLTSTTTQYAFLSGDTLTNSYAYDADSNRVSLTNPQGGVTNYVYDALNRLASLTDFASRQFTFGYDALGRRTSVTRPNGVDTSYSYDLQSRLLSVLHQANSATLDGVSYVYDAAGNRTSKTVLPSNLTSAFSYDPIYQLTQVMQGTKKTESYTYDAVGNRTYQPGAPYTYNSSNEMLTREGVPYTYDNNGSLLSKTNGNGTTSYAWDFENRLSSVNVPSDGVISFTYDPFGRRIRKVSPSGTTIYTYDGNNIEEELNADGTPGERYTYGPGVDEPLVGQREPKIFFYEADGLGSVTSLTDPTGALAATYTYDSFGFLTNSTGNATNWFRYAARQFDSDTALYYYRARYYDPTIGRFISEDPITFRGGVNFYAYVGNGPLNFTDPFGLCPPKNPCAPIGTAPTPSQYEAMGQEVQALASSFGGVFAPAAAATNVMNLAKFHRGWSLDAQVLYGGSTAYANYAYGVYLSASGASLSSALTGANAYAALFSSYPNLEPSDFDPNYWFLPAENVANITKGYNDQQKGTLCTPTN